MQGIVNIITDVTNRSKHIASRKYEHENFLS